MRKKKTSIVSHNSPKTLSDLKFENYTGDSSWLSQQLLAYYKHKSLKLAKDYDELFEILENIKSSCDISSDLQFELRLRNEEITKLQQLVGDLQVRLFQEREDKLILIAENDKLKIQNYQNKKKINLLLMVNGMTEKNFRHFSITDLEGKFIESNLPPKLQKLKEQNNKLMCNCAMSDNNQSSPQDNDPQVLAINNHILSTQLNQHMKITKEQIEVLLKEKELLTEEKIIGINKVQMEVNFLSSKLKENQDLLCSTMEKLLNSERSHEKNKTLWVEEKEKYNRIINFLKTQLGENVPDVFNYDDFIAKRLPSENEVMHQRILEKEKLISSYQEKVLSLQEEISKLTENGNSLKKLFKEKTEKMSALIVYLKNKYKDLDRRRHLEAEGFHSDIKILRDRIKAVDKKLEKASNGIQNGEQQQLLISARNTLNKAKLLEKELASMKTKISSLESNTELSTL